MRVLPALTILLVAPLVFSYTLPLPAQETAKIAFVSPLTGGAAAFGTSARAGIQLAMEEINRTGGVRGKKLILHVEDDKSDPREAAMVARKFVADSSVLAVIGHLNSSCTLAGAPIYNRSGLVELSYGSTNPKISESGEYTFRNCVTDVFQGDFVAAHIITMLKLKRIAVLYDNDDYGRGLSDSFSEAVKRYGGTRVANDAYNRGQSTDFTAQLTRIRSLNPEALFISGLVNEAALIAVQARQVGLDVPLFGADGIFSEDLVKLGGKAVEGVRFSGFFHATSKNKKSAQFVAAYRRRFASDSSLPKDPDAWSAQSYDATYLLKIAMEKGGFTRKGIRDALARIGLSDPLYLGATGVNAFDKNGDMVKPLMMLTVKNGKIVAL